MSVALALDLLVAGLLVATIAYAIVLNRRLSQLRGGSAQMERLINDFYQATARAESGVSALKEVAGQSDSEVIDKLASLTKLHDELEFLVVRAETQAAKLEHLISESRGPTENGLFGLAPDAALDAELFADPVESSSGGDQTRSQPVSKSSSPFVRSVQQEI